MKRLPFVIAGIVIVVVAAVVAVVVIKVQDNNKQPPALQASPGEYRLTPSSGDLPELPVRVSTPAGTRYVMYGAVIDTGKAAQVFVAARQGDPHPAQLTLAAGETKTANGLQLQVTHIWNMPNSAHDAIDVHAVAAP